MLINEKVKVPHIFLPKDRYIIENEVQHIWHELIYNTDNESIKCVTNNRD